MKKMSNIHDMICLTDFFNRRSESSSHQLYLSLKCDLSCFTLVKAWKLVERKKVGDSINNTRENMCLPILSLKYSNYNKSLPQHWIALESLGGILMQWISCPIIHNPPDQQEGIKLEMDQLSIIFLLLLLSSVGGWHFFFDVLVQNMNIIFLPDQIPTSSKIAFPLNLTIEIIDISHQQKYVFSS